MFYPSYICLKQSYIIILFNFYANRYLYFLSFEEFQIDQAFHGSPLECQF